MNDKLTFLQAMWLVCRYMLIILIIGLAVVWFRDATAHHEGGHAVAYIGSYTEAPVRLMLCDDYDAASTVYKGAKDAGQVGFSITFQILNQTPNDEGQPVCGVGVGYLNVLEVYDEGDMPDGVHVTLARVKLSNGSEESDEFYSTLTHVRITDDTVCVECI